MFHVKQSPFLNLPNVSRETFVRGSNLASAGSMFHVKQSQPTIAHVAGWHPVLRGFVRCQRLGVSLDTIGVIAFHAIDILDFD